MRNTPFADPPPLCKYGILDGDALDAAAAGEAADGGLCDSLDVVAEHLAVALGAALSKALASLSASRHVVGFVE